MRISLHQQYAFAMNTESPVVAVMTVDPITVAPDTPLADALAILEENRMRHLPVLNAERRLVGMLSATDCRLLNEADIAGVACTCDPCPETDDCPCGCRAPLLVADVMSSGVVALEPDDTLGLAADLFLSREFHAAPVTEGGALVGIVTSHDLLRAVFADVLPTQAEIEA